MHAQDEKRARLIDLARGGDGIVAPTIEELDPPHIDERGEAYRFRIIQPGMRPGERISIYLESREQAERILTLGDIGI